MPGWPDQNHNYEPFCYWNKIASDTPEAQALAKRLGLTFPTESQYVLTSSLMYPIRRLIITGEDSPSNLIILLGPLWEPTAGGLVQVTRMEVLLPPTPGSPNSLYAEHLDLGSPRWTPRAPSKEEEIEMKKTKEMRKLLAAQRGPRTEVETKVIMDTLLSRDGWMTWKRSNSY